MCEHRTAQESIYQALSHGALSIPGLLDILQNTYGLDRDLAAAALLDAPESIVQVRFAGNEVRLQGAVPVA